MLRSLLLKVRKRLRKLNRSKRHGLTAITILVLSTVAIVYVSKRTRVLTVESTAYAPVLQVIAQGESKGNYNAYFGKAQNQDVRFTNMTIDEVLRWQEDYIKDGSPSSAVGRYQIIRPTLVNLVDQLGLEGTQKFDEALQDRMAIALMERRGSINYAYDKVSRDAYAASIAQEWAALPKVAGENPDQSYYASDGLNKANISVSEITQALDEFKRIHESHK